MGRNVIWSPQPRQAAFERRREYEALYGGAAGGGKSDALLVEAHGATPNDQAADLVEAGQRSVRALERVGAHAVQLDRAGRAGRHAMSAGDAGLAGVRARNGGPARIDIEQFDGAHALAPAAPGASFGMDG